MENNSIIVIALYRFGIGLIASIIVILIKNGYSIVISNFKYGLKDKYVLLGSILGTYLSVIFWLAGYKYTLAGRAAIYNQLSTVLIVLWARIFLNDPLDKRKIIGVVLAVIGAVLVSTSKLL